MKVWSQGLGRLELEFRLSTVNRCGQLVTIDGRTHRPVVWNLRITIEDSDIPNLLRIGMSRAVVCFFFVYIGHRLRRIFIRR